MTACPVCPGCSACSVCTVGYVGYVCTVCTVYSDCVLCPVFYSTYSLFWLIFYSSVAEPYTAFLSWITCDVYLLSYSISCFPAIFEAKLFSPVLFILVILPAWSSYSILIYLVLSAIFCSTEAT